jgi:plastocyanin
MRKTLILMTILFVSTLSIGDLYRTTVDTDYGFYQVRNENNLSANFTYVDKTLNINVGDTLEWINMADPDEKITIDGFEIVDDNTFGNIFYHTLRWNYQKYSYKFDKVGKYRIHIDEYPRIISQTIIVSNKNSESGIIQSSTSQYKDETISTINSQEIVTITDVPTPVPQYQTNNAPKNISGFGFLISLVVFIYFVIKR